jgi:hypothetical protein
MYIKLLIKKCILKNENKGEIISLIFRQKIYLYNNLAKPLCTVCAFSISS